MPKILIIDDEPHIRESILRKLEQMGLNEILESGDGIEAHKIINAYAPDIVITDIRMPGMDGIKLISSVNEQSTKHVIFIILSGYDLFEYTQKAISLRAFAYLLKPINSDELENIILKALDHLAHLKKQEENEAIIDQKMRQGIDLGRRHFFRELCQTGNPNTDFINRKLKELDISFRFNGFAPALVRIDTLATQKPSVSSRDTELYIFNVENIIGEVLLTCNIDIYPFNDDNGQGFLLNLDMLSNMSPQKFNEIFNDAKNNIKNILGFSITAGIGKITDSLSDIHLSYKTAVTALSQRMLKGDGNIYFYIDNNLVKRKCSVIDFTYEQCILEAIEKLDKLQSVNLIKELYNQLTENGCVDLETLNNINYQLILLIYKILKHLSIDPEKEFGDEFTQYRKVNLMQSINEMVSFFDNMLNNIFIALEAVKRPTNSRLMGVVKDYILSNYAKEITLDKLSELVHLTPTYVSKLFKQEFDETLIDFIIKVRISKAKELLREGIYKSNEVCKMVGFNDVKYFYKIFKKYTGLKPSDYKVLPPS